MQGSLSVERMCRVAAVSRASFYRWLEPSMPVEEEMEVRSTIHSVALEHRRCYGYRRVTRELRRRGLVINHKRVARLMKEGPPRRTGRPAAGLGGNHQLGA